MSDQSTPLFVRVSTAQAQRLDHVAHSTGRPKRAIVDDLLRDHLDPEVPMPSVPHPEHRPAKEPPSPAPASPLIVEPDVLTARQAARLLQVDEQDVIELAELGELPGRRIAGQWRFARDAVLSWLGRS
jgi:excisionase family DNA binding protein